MTLVENAEREVTDFEEARVDEAHSKNLCGAHQHPVAFLAHLPPLSVPRGHLHTRKLRYGAGGDVAVLFDVLGLLIHQSTSRHNKDDVFGLLSGEQVTNELHGNQGLALNPKP